MEPPLRHSQLLIESRYAVGAAVAGFMLALLVSHGSLMAAFGVLALIAGAGWAGQRIFQRHHEEGESG
jgi:hypothetical protein